MDNLRKDQIVLLRRVAREAMLERGLEPGFSPALLAELSRIEAPASASGPAIRDLRSVLWCSIDNDDSRDLDQLNAWQPGGSDGTERLLVAVADVDALVPRGSAINERARNNSTSVYTPAEIFPMLPEKLSTDLTSLNPDQERLALVVAMDIGEDGSLVAEDVHRARVWNHAQLAYDSVGAWLEGKGAEPERVSRVPGLAESLRAQDRLAQLLRRRRHEQGALDLETIQVQVHFRDGSVDRLEPRRRGRGRQLIEDLMVAANGVIARYLAARGFVSVRRVVRSPERWARIVDLARELGDSLPPEPDSRALMAFLERQREADPLRFPDLSLSVIKMLGKGEYAVERPEAEPTGHFGLAVRDYAHSTAPNRRFPDLITQRLLKAALDGLPSPYGEAELDQLAHHATAMEDAANKVERLAGKAAAACLLADRIGVDLDGLVTGASPKGTWVRILDPPVEGKVVSGYKGLDVGDRVRVRLVAIDAARGHIDFARL